VKELLKDFFRGFFYVLEGFPIITGIIFLVLSIYLMKTVLPKSFNTDTKKRSLYSYWNNLGIVFVFTFFSLVILVIQIFRIVSSFAK
jgi:Na+-transporting methylmalonyl-CoA/oxaloacetate decarboxylase gamma subunit